MNLSKVRVVPVLTIFAAALVSGCGSDSSGPPSGEIDANAALQSLSLGLQGVAIGVAPTTPEPNATFGGIAPVLDQVNVTLDGGSQGMFALGLRESFPAGTCEETFLVISFPSEPGSCTPPSLGVLIILWQAHSATQPPDRLILILGDPGTSNFELDATPEGSTTALAFFLDGKSDIWTSLSGTITSETTATSQTCDLSLPPYAQSGTCSIATFAEQGSVVFEPFTLNLPTTQRRNLVIPPIGLHGLWLDITAIKPFPGTPNQLLPSQILSPRILAQSLAARLAAPPTPAR